MTTIIGYHGSRHLSSGKLHSLLELSLRPGVAPRDETPTRRCGAGGGQSSRFYQHLVKERQLAVSIQARPEARIGPSLFEITATPRPSVKPDVLEKAIYEEIESVQKDGVTAQEIEKARHQYVRSQIQGRQSSMQTAIRFGQYAVYFNDPDLSNTSFDKFNAVTEEQVKQAAQKYLVPSERTVVTTLPEKAQARPAVGQ